MHLQTRVIEQQIVLTATLTEGIYMRMLAEDQGAFCRSLTFGVIAIMQLAGHHLVE